MSRKTFTKIPQPTLGEVLNGAWPRCVGFYLLGALSAIEADIIVYFHNRIRPKLNDKANNRKYWHQGKMWNYDTLETLHKIFPEKSLMTLRRSLENLRQKNFLLTGHFHRDKSVRTTWYSVNYDMKLWIGHPLPAKTPTKADKVDPDKEKIFTSHLFKKPGKRTNAFVQNPGKKNKCICSKSRGNEQMKDYIHTIDSTKDESRLRRSSRPHRPDDVSEENVSDTMHHASRSRSAESEERVGKRLSMEEQHSGVGEQAKKKRAAETVAKTKEKLNAAATLYIAENLWMALISYTDPEGIVNLSKKERGMMKSLLKELHEEDVRPGDFLDFAVTHWGDIRKKLTWPDNPKKFRLGEHPFFQELYFNRNDIVRLFRKNLSKPAAQKGDTPTEYVYTRVEDIPKKHPRYKNLVAQIEVTGRATTLIKGTD